MSLDEERAASSGQQQTWTQRLLQPVRQLLGSFTPADPRSLPATPTPSDVAGYISRCLQQNSIPHAIGGALALAVWGCPRPTADVDILVECNSPALMRKIVALLTDDNPEDVEDIFKMAEKSVCLGC